MLDPNTNLMRAFGATDLEASCYPDCEFNTISPKEFLILGELVLELAGEQRKGWFHEFVEYRDLVFAAQARSINGIREVELERVSNNNPVLMATDGKIIRSHGEHIYVLPHLRALVRRLMADHATVYEVD